MSVCSMAGCQKQNAVRGLCWEHYPMVYKPTFMLRFSRKLNKR